MGKSRSLEDQAKVNRSFFNYMQEQEQLMNASVAEAEKNVGADVAKFARSYDDLQLLAKKQYQHFSTLSEWSLDAISKMIDSIANTFFAGGDLKSLGGKGTSPAALVGMSPMEIAIAQTVVSAISTILQGFHTTTQTDISKQQLMVSAAPGLTVFLGIHERAFAAKGFTLSENIVQNAYYFEAYWSTKQNASAEAISAIQALNKTGISLRESLQIANKRVATLDPFDDKDEIMLAKLNGIITNFTSREKLLIEEIRKMK